MKRSTLEAIALIVIMLVCMVDLDATLDRWLGPVPMDDACWNERCEP